MKLITVVFHYVLLPRRDQDRDVARDVPTRVNYVIHIHTVKHRQPQLTDDYCSNSGMNVLLLLTLRMHLCRVYLEICSFKFFLVSLSL